MAPRSMDPESLELLEDGLRKTMLSTSGAELDAALAELGWADMLSDMSERGDTAGVPAAWAKQVRTPRFSTTWCF